MLKKQNGITLIALVITIIVLLILAGVSIAMLTGQNGTLTQASNAQKSTREAEIKEAISLGVSTVNATIADPTSTTYTALTYDNIADAINKSQGAGTATAATDGIDYVYGGKTYTAKFTITTNANGSGSISSISAITEKSGT